MSMNDKEARDLLDYKQDDHPDEQSEKAPPIIEEITIEEMAVDGICGIY